MKNLTSIFTVSLVILGTLSNNGFTQNFAQDTNEDIFESCIDSQPKNNKSNVTNFTRDSRNISDTVSPNDRDFALNNNDSDIFDDNEEDNDDIWSTYVDSSTSKSNKVNNQSNNSNYNSYDGFENLNINELQKALANQPVFNNDEDNNAKKNSKILKDINKILNDIERESNVKVNNNKSQEKINKNFFDDFELVDINPQTTDDDFEVIDITSKDLKADYEKQLSNMESNIKENYKNFIASIRDIIQSGDKVIQDTYYTQPEYKIIKRKRKKDIYNNSTGKYIETITFNSIEQVAIPGTKQQVPEANYRGMFNRLEKYTSEFFELVQCLCYEVYSDYKNIIDQITNLNNSQEDIFSKKEILNDINQEVQENFVKYIQNINKLLFVDDSDIFNSFGRITGFNYIEKLNSIIMDASKITFCANKSVIGLKASLTEFVQQIKNANNFIKDKFSNINLNDFPEK